MKAGIVLAVVLVGLSLLGACGKVDRDMAAPSPQSMSTSTVDACYTYEFFVSEGELIAAVEAKRADPSADEERVGSLTEYCRPGTVPAGLVLDGINVAGGGNGGSAYVEVIYSAAEGRRVSASLLWFRERAEESVVRAEAGAGQTLEWVQRKGVSYALYRSETACSVYWICDHRSFSASFTGDFSDEEMLAFCQYEVVPIA